MDEGSTTPYAEDVPICRPPTWDDAASEPRVPKQHHRRQIEAYSRAVSGGSKYSFIVIIITPFTTVTTIPASLNFSDYKPI